MVGTASFKMSFSTGAVVILATFSSIVSGVRIFVAIPSPFVKGISFRNSSGKINFSYYKTNGAHRQVDYFVFLQIISKIPRFYVNNMA
jgi:hypothetical protein